MRYAIDDLSGMRNEQLVLEQFVVKNLFVVGLFYFILGGFYD